MSVLEIAGASFLGALIFALLGWVQSNEPWVTRKFMASALRGIIGAIGYAALYQYTGHVITLVDLAGAFMVGTGFDTGVKSIGDTLKAKLNKDGAL